MRVTITANDTRLVRSQSYLQQEVARALEDRLGWRVSPTGSAKLNLAMSEEKIESTGSDSRNIPARWNIKLTGHAVFSSQHGHLMSDFSGTGHASALADEPAALQQAAANAANSIAAWLEREGANWK